MRRCMYQVDIRWWAWWNAELGALWACVFTQSGPFLGHVGCNASAEVLSVCILLHSTPAVAAAAKAPKAQPVPHSAIRLASRNSYSGPKGGWRLAGA